MAIDTVEKSIKIIREVADLSASIATAVEEETATINEISENTHAVREEISQMATKSSEIVTSNQGTAADSEKVKDTASLLTKLSDDLMDLIDQFRV